MLKTTTTKDHVPARWGRERERERGREREREGERERDSLYLNSLKYSNSQPFFKTD